MNTILEVKNLTKEFKEFSIKNISFSLERGFITGFIGPNGAGKSTTIKLILNLLRKDAGEIKVFGLDHLEHEMEIKNRVGFVLDENYLYEELTISEIKRIIAPFYSKWDSHIFDRYIKEFGLSPRKKIKELSKGMKMKFSLVIALSHQAELLIMDEPTSGLDPLIRSELLEILQQVMHDENKGIFFSTHITSDLDKIADYIVMIHEGKIVLHASKDEIMEAHGLVKGDVALLDSYTRSQFISVKENKFGFEGLAKDKEQVKRLFAGKSVVEKPTLEDIMLFYTRRNQNA